MLKKSKAFFLPKGSIRLIDLTFFHLYHGSVSVIEGIKKFKHTLSRSDRMSTIAIALYDMPTQTISEDLARESAGGRCVRRDAELSICQSTLKRQVL